jgi:transcriptional regulator with XRE-family HTH domain
METFSSNLKRRAEQLGISNAEVARRVGLSERRYGNYVSGTRQPDLATLVKISSVLKTSLDELLSDEVKKPAKSAKRNLQERIASAVEVLSEEDLARIAIMLDALAAARS